MPSRKRSPRKSIRAPHSAIRVFPRGLGWIPDRPDQRDFLYAAPPAFLRALPPRVDLRRECPPVYDQGQLGSCTANAIGGAIEFDQMKERLPQVFIPSRLFIYYNERVLESSVASDAGAMLRDGIKTVAKQGACPEPLWPYVVSKFKLKPPVSCYTEAAKHTAVTYQRLIPTLAQLQGCLATGYPFVFGFTVYESFMTATVARTGKAPMPGTRERVTGGHAVCVVGYDDTARVFICRNSWGTGWGMRGYFTIPYAYLTSSELSSDFWTIRTVS